VTWKVLFLSDVSFQTTNRSKIQKKIKTKFWQYKNRSLLRNRNLQNSDCFKIGEKVGWGGHGQRNDWADSGVLAALCVFYLLKTCKHILSCTAYATWGDIFECCFKAQSSNLERLFYHVSVKRDFQALSFELCKSFRNCHLKWPRGLAVLRISCVSRKHTMPPKPAMMAAWLDKAREDKSRTVTYSPAALAPPR